MTEIKTLSSSKTYEKKYSKALKNFNTIGTKLGFHNGNIYHPKKGDQIQFYTSLAKTTLEVLKFTGDHEKPLSKPIQFNFGQLKLEFLYRDLSINKKHPMVGEVKEAIASTFYSEKSEQSEQKIYTHKNHFGMFSPVNIIKNLINDVEWDATTTQRRDTRDNRYPI